MTQHGRRKGRQAPGDGKRKVHPERARGDPFGRRINERVEMNIRISEVRRGGKRGSPFAGELSPRPPPPRPAPVVKKREIEKGERGGEGEITS